MLTDICYQFPVQTNTELDFFRLLKQLFEEFNNVFIEKNTITVIPINPQNCLPKTIIEHSHTTHPTVTMKFDNENESELNSSFQKMLVIINKEITKASCTFHELTPKISGHLKRIDHTGVNVPSSQLSETQWDTFIHNLALTTTLYRYPTGDDWPFILPATPTEYRDDIHDFVLGREPKFELVYDRYSLLPTFQFDIETDLTQLEVESLFPNPLGESFSGLENVFRAVYIESPWDTIRIRFDIRFKDEGKDNDWLTGKWLVEEGGRIK